MNISAQVAEAMMGTAISEAKPRNPRHFDGIKGGRKRVSDVFVGKDSVSCTRGAQPLFHTLFGVKALSGTLWAPPLMSRVIAYVSSITAGFLA